MKVIASEIEYDTDDLTGLPETLEIEIPVEQEIEDVVELEEYVSDQISNITGFCHKGYVSEVRPSPQELEKFLNDWGQSHKEICSCLGYDEKDSDDLLMDEYFWYNNKLWVNKHASGMTGIEQEIATYLRTK